MRKRIISSLCTLMISLFTIFPYNIYAQTRNPATGDSFIGCIILLIISTAGCTIGLAMLSKRVLDKNIYNIKD